MSDVPPVTAIPAASKPRRMSDEERNDALTYAIGTQVEQGERVQWRGRFDAITVKGEKKTWNSWGGAKRTSVVVDVWGTTTLKQC
jgi:hypothetical protein